MEQTKVEKKSELYAQIKEVLEEFNGLGPMAKGDVLKTLAQDWEEGR